MQIREEKIRKAGIRSGVVATLMILIFVLSITMPQPVIINEPEWHIIWKGNAASAAEANPGTGASGWLATFQLNYSVAEVPALTSNATNGSYDGWSNVSGYQNVDNKNKDLASESGNYFVARARFNKTHAWKSTIFDDSRCSIRLTTSGFNTDVADVEGTKVVSMNNTGYDYIYINFYWNETTQGYWIADDGAVSWNITISAKY